MGTRIRKNPAHLFELFCEIGIPTNSNKAPWIAWMYPYSFKNDEILKSVPEFSYPCEFLNNAVQHFSFVLTNIDSKWTFGFCRHAPDSSTCFVILSFLPWHEVFYKILNHIAELSNKEKTSKSKNLQLFLENIYQAPIPEPGLELHINYGENEEFVAVCLDHEKLPAIPENRNITEYFNAIDAHNMMTIFASMLHERRILITSKKLSRLSACIQAANALIYPMHWQHIFIPVLPKHLSDYLSAPMPFLIGIPSATLSRIKVADMGDIVYLDADENKIESPFADLDALPTDVLQSLRHDLKHPQEMLGDAVARAFLKALVKLIGGYWNALKLKPGEKITFSSELFVQTRPSAMQPFLQKMLELQIFQQFIDCRLKKLNSGQGVSDEFEFELTSHEDKASFRLRNQYREWVSNMKKEGGAFLKNVKTKVKVTGKKAYQDIRSKIHDIHNQKEEKPSIHKRSGSVPNSLSNGFDSNSRKQHNLKNMYKKEALIVAMSKESQSGQYSTLQESEDAHSDSTDTRKNVLDSPQLTFQPIDMDLMGDLHELIFRSCSLCSESFKQRTSISDPQLIDLSPEVEKVPCASCLQNNTVSDDSEPAPPPLLPRPPSTKSKGFPRSSSTSSETSDTLPSKLLIEFDKDISTSIDTSDDLFNVPCNTSSDKDVFERTTFQSNRKSPFSTDSVNQQRLTLRPTNPFYNESITVPRHAETTSIYKSSSGPNVRNMINLWQASTSPTETANQCLSSMSDKFKSGVSLVSPYRSQPLSRTLSTPPSAFSGVQNITCQTSVMTRKSTLSPISTNPFVVPENKSGSSCQAGSNDTNTANTNISSSWENFH